MIVILFRQICLMFLLMAIGYLLVKTGKLGLSGSQALGNILLYVVIPAVIIQSFMTPWTSERWIGLGFSMLAALLCLVVSMMIAMMFFHHYPVENFGAAFSNAGFIGIPIVAALYGEEAVFYVSSFVAFVNFFQWTYGVFILTKSPAAISFKKLTGNPVIISLVIGLIVFSLEIPVPELLKTAIGHLSNLNAPLAMFSLGTYLAKVPLKSVFTSQLAWLVSMVRLLIIPLLTIMVLIVIPNLDVTMKMTMLIAAATPVGSNVAIFAQLYDQDYEQAVKDVCLSTLLSIVSLPAVYLLAGTIF